MPDSKIQELLLRGADIHHRDPLNDNDTPLHYACRLGQLDVITTLIDLGADVNALNDMGYTPLELLQQRQKDETSRVAEVRKAEKSMKHMEYKRIWKEKMKRRLDEGKMDEEELEFAKMMKERLAALQAMTANKAGELKNLAIQQERDEYMMKIKRAASRMVGGGTPGGMFGIRQTDGSGVAGLAGSGNDTDDVAERSRTEAFQNAKQSLLDTVKQMGDEQQRLRDEKRKMTKEAELHRQALERQQERSVVLSRKKQKEQMIEGMERDRERRKEEEKLAKLEQEVWFTKVRRAWDDDDREWRAWVAVQRTKEDEKAERAKKEAELQAEMAKIETSMRAAEADRQLKAAAEREGKLAEEEEELRLRVTQQELELQNIREKIATGTFDLGIEDPADNIIELPPPEKEEEDLEHLQRTAEMQAAVARRIQVMDERQSAKQKAETEWEREEREKMMKVAGLANTMKDMGSTIGSIGNVFGGWLEGRKADAEEAEKTSAFENKKREMQKQAQELEQKLRVAKEEYKTASMTKQFELKQAETKQLPPKAPPKGERRSLFRASDYVPSYAKGGINNLLGGAGAPEADSAPRGTELGAKTPTPPMAPGRGGAAIIVDTEEAADLSYPDIRFMWEEAEAAAAARAQELAKKKSSVGSLQLDTAPEEVQKSNLDWKKKQLEMFKSRFLILTDTKESDVVSDEKLQEEMYEERRRAANVALQMENKNKMEVQEKMLNQMLAVEAEVRDQEYVTRRKHELEEEMLLHKQEQLKKQSAALEETLNDQRSMASMISGFNPFSWGASGSASAGTDAFGNSMPSRDEILRRRELREKHEARLQELEEKKQREVEKQQKLVNAQRERLKRMQMSSSGTVGLQQAEVSGYEVVGTQGQDVTDELMGDADMQLLLSTNASQSAATAAVDYEELALQEELERQKKLSELEQKAWKRRHDAMMLKLQQWNEKKLSPLEDQMAAQEVEFSAKAAQLEMEAARKLQQQANEELRQLQASLDDEEAILQDARNNSSGGLLGAVTSLLGFTGSKQSSTQVDVAYGGSISYGADTSGMISAMRGQMGDTTNNLKYNALRDQIAQVQQDRMQCKIGRLDKSRAAVGDFESNSQELQNKLKDMAAATKKMERDQSKQLAMQQQLISSSNPGGDPSAKEQAMLKRHKEILTKKAELKQAADARQAQAMQEMMARQQQDALTYKQLGAGGNVQERMAFRMNDKQEMMRREGEMSALLQEKEQTKIEMENIKRKAQDEVARSTAERHKREVQRRKLQVMEDKMGQLMHEEELQRAAKAGQLEQSRALTQKKIFRAAETRNGADLAQAQIAVAQETQAMHYMKKDMSKQLATTELVEYLTNSTKAKSKV